MISFYHLADIHLDQPFSTLASVDGFPSKRREEIFSEFKRILKQAIEEQPDFLFISGDMYEHEYTKIKTIKEINEYFSKLKGRVILICGNHDPESKNSFYSSYPWASNVFILGRKKPYMFFEEKKVCVYGIGYDTGGGQFRELETIKTDRRYTNVLMLHGDADLSISTYNSVNSELLKDIGFDYVAMGHNHKMYVKDNIYNPGSLCQLKFDDEGEHGYFKGDLETKTIEFVESRSRKYADITIPYEKLSTFEQEYPDKSTIYRIKVTGMKKENDIINPIEGYDYLHIIDKRELPKRANRETVSQGIKGRFEKAMNERIMKASTEEKEIYKDALDLGLKALMNEGLDLE